jgi:hypothetical protein
MSTITERRGGAIALGLTATLCYLAATARHLDGVGLYYDEVFQAPAAFAYIGRRPTMFAPISLGAVPLLNGSYVGALKSGIYGLYLRLSGNPFTTFSWRMTGIFLVLCGLIVFSVAAAGRLRLQALALFYALLLSDVNILLATRHDFGPAALCLLLRLLILSVWLHAWTPHASGRIAPHPVHAAALGLLLGTALFEKATAVVLLPILAVYMLLLPERHRAQWAAMGLGLSVGVLPLVLSNLVSYFNGGGLVSLYPIAKSWRGFASPGETIRFLSDYLSLGQGRDASFWILGLSSGDVRANVESVLILIILGLALREAFLHPKEDASADRLAGAMALCYAAVGAALLLLPYRLDFQHKLIGTPFQYLAIAVWSASPPRIKADLVAVTRLKLLLPLVLVLLRLPALAGMQRAVTDERAGVVWDKSFTTVARFAADHADRAVFVAADWGFAPQIYCMSQGRENLVFEPFWSYSGPPDLERILEAAANKQEIYILYRKFRTPLNPESTRRLIDDLISLKSWRQKSDASGLMDSRAIGVIRLVRRSADRPN